MPDLLMKRPDQLEEDARTEMKRVRSRFHDTENFVDKEFDLTIGCIFGVLS